MLRSNRALAAALAATVALAAGGCGGDGDEETSSVTTSEQGSAQATAPGDSGPAGGASEGGGEEGAGRDSSASAEEQGSPAGGQSGSDSSPPPVSASPQEGSKAAAPGVPTSKHGDNSIQTYGVEAGSQERSEVAATVQSFYDARAARDWAQACSMLAARPRAELERLLKGSEGGAEGCAEVMGGLSQQVPTSAFAEEAEIEEVLSLRVDDEYAFLIYTRPSGKVYATPVTEEGGWKIVSIGPSEISG